MKITRLLFTTLTMAVVLLTTSCGTKRAVTASGTATPSDAELQKAQQTLAFLQKVTDQAQYARVITSKIDFTAGMDGRELSLSGQLKMRRDQVIRLQLLAFGVMEAARLEFTPDHVTLIDRINKQYVQVPYSQVQFLRTSGIDFYVLQALFWNELFQPGERKITDALLKNYTAEPDAANGMIVSFDRKPLAYRWTAQRDNARLTATHATYHDNTHGQFALNWAYSNFKANGQKVFPMNQHVSFTMPGKSLKFDLQLKDIGADDSFENETQLSGKYKRVTLEDILRLISN